MELEQQLRLVESSLVEARRKVAALIARKDRLERSIAIRDTVSEQVNTARADNNAEAEQIWQERRDLNSAFDPDNELDISEFAILLTREDERRIK